MKTIIICFALLMMAQPVTADTGEKGLLYSKLCRLYWQRSAHHFEGLTLVNMTRGETILWLANVSTTSKELGYMLASLDEPTSEKAQMLVPKLCLIEPNHGIVVSAQ